MLKNKFENASAEITVLQYYSCCDAVKPVKVDSCQVSALDVSACQGRLGYSRIAFLQSPSSHSRNNLDATTYDYCNDTHAQIISKAKSKETGPSVQSRGRGRRYW